MLMRTFSEKEEKCTVMVYGVCLYKGGKEWMIKKKCVKGVKFCALVEK